MWLVLFPGLLHRLSLRSLVKEKWKGRKVGNFWVILLKGLIFKPLTVLKKKKDVCLEVLDPLERPCKKKI
jgi:hypothetical protein